MWLNRLSPRKILLLDSVGALLTAILLGVVFPVFEDAIGFSKVYLFPLSLIAVLYSIYSFTCYMILPEYRKLLLRIIAIANLVYCGFTSGLVVYQYENITALGTLYFTGEIIVISILAVVELKVAKTLFINNNFKK